MDHKSQIHHYQIQNLIGSGGSSKVYHVKNSCTNENLALKLSNGFNLDKEIRITTSLSQVKGVPKIRDSGVFKLNSYFVTDLLGTNLTYDDTQTPYLFQSICRLAVRVLNILEGIHDNGIVHRDIKPANCLVSLDGKDVYLIDYGISKYFMSKGVHKTFGKKMKYKGTPSFASIYSHLGYKESRRDDLEGLFYFMVYLKLGSLPWTESTNLTGLDKWNWILKKKQLFLSSQLSKILPLELLEYYKYTKSLRYEQKPNYKFLRSLFEKNSETSLDLKSNLLFHIYPADNISKEKNSEKSSNKLKFSRLRYKSTPKFSYKDKKSQKKINKSIHLIGDSSNIENRKGKYSSSSKTKKEKLSGNMNIHSSLLEIVKINDFIENTNVSKPKMKILLNDSNTITSSYIDEDPGTPKYELPEFKNRDFIFKHKQTNNFENQELNQSSCNPF